MASINIYRIDRSKQKDFLDEIDQRMVLCNVVRREYAEGDYFELYLYIEDKLKGKPLSWGWVLDVFNVPAIETYSPPRAVIVIKHGDEVIYGVTFGFSFFLVDKFCDYDFGFSFARKLKFDGIKTTTLTTPNSMRNKTVHTYVNYSDLEFDSGESFAKLKAKVSTDKDFALYKPTIEVGNSIKFSIENESIEHIIDLVLHIEYVLAEEKDNYLIPVFTKLSDSCLLSCVEAKMVSALKDGNIPLNISELDIVGATEIFNHNDGEYILKFKGVEKPIPLLSGEEIQLFCSDNGFDYASSVLNISVVSLRDGHTVVTNKVRELIDYTDDEEKCLLSKGVWYRYNEDYQNYLENSISEIQCEYHPEYDFSEEMHSAYIEDQYKQERHLQNNIGKTEEELKRELRNIHYAERVFNSLRVSDGFENYDRVLNKDGKSSFELMDLYKDGMMFAVKIGNTSTKLCYAVDQSLNALKQYKKGTLTGLPQITTVGLWFILERKTHIEDVNGNPDINKLEMLLLKNRIDQWKKKVRSDGFKPLIYINYRNV